MAAELRLVGSQQLVEVQIISWPRHLSNARGRASLLVTCGPDVGGGSTAQRWQESQVGYFALRFLSRSSAAVDLSTGADRRVGRALLGGL